MSLNDSKGALSQAVKDLMARWADVQAVWSDAQSQEFEKTYLAPLVQDVRSALGAMDHLNHVLLMIENECG